MKIRFQNFVKKSFSCYTSVGTEKVLTYTRENHQNDELEKRSSQPRKLVLVPANIEKLMRLKLIRVEAELMLYIITTIKYLPLNINLKYLYNALNSKDTNNKRLFSKIFLAG